MDVFFRKKFLKQLARIPASIRAIIELSVFHEIPHSKSISDIGKFEKMQGYAGYYKARFGSYRVGIELKSDDHVIIHTVMHRKEIYRYFP